MNQSLHTFAQQFIKDRYMAVVSCVSFGSPRSFTCWYGVVNGKIYWKSRVESTHSRAFVANPEASMCIYDHGATYPDNKTGVQILGTVSIVDDREEIESLIHSLAERFGEGVYAKNNIDELCDPKTMSKFYSFSPLHMKLVAKDMDVHMEEYEDFVL